MAGFRIPGPLCREGGALDIDVGTLCRQASPQPGPVGSYPEDFGQPAGRIPINERIDPGVDTLERLDRYGQPYRTARETEEQGRIFRLEERTARSFRALRAAAALAGFTKELFTLTSDYRSSKKQAIRAAAAREKYGDAKKAGVFVAQGRSEHITGRAFDLNLGIANSGENAKARAFDRLPAYQWLKENAPRFGLNPYPYTDAEHPGEPWHWSYNTR